MSTKVISKVSTIASLVRKSTIAAEIFEGEKRLQPSVPTRWNSQQLMIKSILEVKKTKRNSLFSFTGTDGEHTTFHSTKESKLDDYIIKHTVPDDSDPLSF